MLTIWLGGIVEMTLHAFLIWSFIVLIIYNSNSALLIIFAHTGTEIIVLYFMYCYFLMLAFVIFNNIYFGHKHLYKGLYASISYEFPKCLMSKFGTYDSYNRDFVFYILTLARWCMGFLHIPVSSFLLYKAMTRYV